jgi:hypothetical protein
MPYDQGLWKSVLLRGYRRTAPPGAPVIPPPLDEPHAEANGPYACVQGASISASRAGSFTRVGGGTVIWDWGDGTQSGPFPNNASADVTHQFNLAPGAYPAKITLIVTDTTNGKTASDTADLTVTAPSATVDEVVVTPDPVTIVVGGSQVMQAVAKAAGVIVAGKLATWASNNPSVASVSAGPSASATVQANAQGVAAITATIDGIASDPVTVTVQPVPSEGDTPHLPSGSSFVGTRTFDTLTESGWFNSGTLSVRDATTYAPSGVSAPGVPSKGGPMIGEMRFSAARAGGSPPGSTGKSGVAALNYKRLYVQLLGHKLSNNWQGHNSSVNKVLIVNMHGNPCLVLSASGIGSATLLWQFRLQNLGTANGTRNINATMNSSSAVVTRGVYQDIELVCGANTPGVADGTLDLYVRTGGGVFVQTHHVTDIKWSDVGQAVVWESPRWEPIWGGTGDVVFATMYAWLAEINVYGRVAA